MQPRRLSRELALMAISQLPSKLESKVDTGGAQDISEILTSAVKTLQTEAREALEGAGGS